MTETRIKTVTFSVLTVRIVSENRSCVKTQTEVLRFLFKPTLP